MLVDDLERDLAIMYERPEGDMFSMATLEEMCLRKAAEGALRIVEAIRRGERVDWSEGWRQFRAYGALNVA